MKIHYLWQYDILIYKILMILKVSIPGGQIKFSWKFLGKKAVYGPGDTEDIAWYILHTKQGHMKI